MSAPGAKRTPRELRDQRRRRGHSATSTTVPEEVWPLLDDVVEIPMIGRGASLNVAVAGSLVLYRLAGLG